MEELHGQELRALRPKSAVSPTTRLLAALAPRTLSCSSGSQDSKQERAPLPRVAHAKSRTERTLVATVVALFALNIVLMIGALAKGATSVRDGSGSITNGWIISGGIALTLVIVVGLQWVPISHTMRHLSQILALVAQALHSLGHLWGFYYSIWFYDDILHTILTAALAVLLNAIVIQPIPRRLVTPRAIFAGVVIFAIAAAGIWEIFEYSADRVLGTREQDDLDDTMQDMIDGTLGGVALGGLAAWATQREITNDPKWWRSRKPVSDDKPE